MRPAPTLLASLRLAILVLPLGCGGGGDGTAAPAGATAGTASAGDVASAVLITLDTTRADVLGCYGGEARTPRLDRLAAEGVLYESAFTTVPITLPAHCSMLTGLYPPRHTVRDNGISALPPAAATLAEAAREAGIRTGAFLGAVVLDRTFGLDQGFEVYDLPPKSALQRGSEFAERDAGRVVDAALGWVEGLAPDDPLFLWVHLFDPHIPYLPPPELREGTDERALYRGEVAYVDREIGRLLDGLEAAGALADATVLVVGDHGEAFGEHGERTHAFFCYDTTLRVPFLLRHADGRRAGERSSEIVSVVDVAPTLAQAMGLAPFGTLGGIESGIDGRSLFDPVPAERGVYFESFFSHLAYRWSPLAGWVAGEGKYIHSSEPEFYVLSEDPGETSDVFDGKAEVVDRYVGAISRVAAAEALPAVEEGIEDEELLGAIRGLGYTASGAVTEEFPHPLEPTSAPSPVDMIDVHYETLEAVQMLSGGNPQMGIIILGRLVRESPHNYLARDKLAAAYMRMERPGDAVPLLEAVVANGPPWPGSRFNLGLCLFDTGRPEEGIEMVRRAIELDPATPHFYSAMIVLLQRSGRGAEALPYQRKLQELTR